MKKIIFFLILAVSVGASLVFSYSLTDSDTAALDRAEEKIFTLIDDQSNPYDAQVFIDLIDRALSEYDLSERQIIFLEIISDDIAWEYEIGDYADISYDEMWSDDCSEDEYYDEQDQMCYFLEDENYDNESQYEAGEFTGSHEEHESEILAEYSISKNIITLQSGEDGIKNQEVWNVFTALVPESVRKNFSLYQVSNDSSSDTAAHVVQTQEDNTKWILHVNLDAFYIDGVLEPEESYGTLIHEFAHVLTLGKNQMRYYPITDNEALLERFAQNCEYQLLQEGCMNAGSYVDDFMSLYWDDSEYVDKVRNKEVYAYDDTPESFVTEYAATNPGEDIAESFTYFVLRGKPEGNTIADQKLNFFYNYKELESLRKQIRSNLAKMK